MDKKQQDKPMNARHEQHFEGTVMFAGNSDLVCHLPTERCGTQEPHKMEDCNEFEIITKG